MNKYSIADISVSELQKIRKKYPKNSLQTYEEGTFTVIDSGCLIHNWTDKMFYYVRLSNTEYKSRAYYLLDEQLEPCELYKPLMAKMSIKFKLVKGQVKQL